MSLYNRFVLKGWMLGLKWKQGRRESLSPRSYLYFVMSTNMPLAIVEPHSAAYQ